MAQVVVVGSLNMDLVVRTEQMPQPGETVRGRDFVTVPGGKGANQAAAAARLGNQVEMIGCVGGDAFGTLMVDNLRQQGVGVSGVRVDAGSASGVAMIVVDALGENAIVIAPGANGRVTAEDVDAGRHLLQGARFLVLQLEIPLPVVRYAMTLARQLGVAVVLNPAPAAASAAEWLDGADYVIVNETEAQLLSGLAVNDLSDAGRAGRALRTRGAPVVIVTLGAQGALLVHAGGAVHVPARPVKVVDTTAAGDAFVGGFVSALLRGYETVEAVRYATCAGSCAVMALGAQTSLPSAEQVQQLYQGGLP